MIGYLRGRIVERNEEGVILEAGGVGYDLTCSTNTLIGLPGDEDAQLWVHTHVREDQIALFGFAAPMEKKMFLSLLSVTGVGPKMAIKILSAASLDHLANLIETGDVKGLSGLPKVGKKTAEQLVLTLRGKLVMHPEEAKSGKKKSVPSALLPRFTGTRAQILSALVNLGFRSQDAEPVVGSMPEEIDIQAGVRQGLQALTGAH